MLLLLWLYVSGLAVLVGAELNSVIEHASPQGKDPGERTVGGRRRLADGRLPQSDDASHLGPQDGGYFRERDPLGNVSA